MNPSDQYIFPGSVVSIQLDGLLSSNAGTTVYKNDYIFENHAMLNLQSVSIKEDVLVCVYHGGLMVVKLNQNHGVLFEKRVPLYLHVFQIVSITFCSNWETSPDR